VYVEVIYEQLKFAHLARSTLCGPRKWNKSTYSCQLFLFWASLIQFTFPSHAVCLGFITIFPSYSRSNRRNEEHINNGKKVLSDWFFFPNINLNVEIIIK